MDPYVLTLVKRGLVLGLAAGALVALGYLIVQYPKLQYAMTLNMIPPQVQ